MTLDIVSPLADRREIAPATLTVLESLASRHFRGRCLPLGLNPRFELAGRFAFLWQLDVGVGTRSLTKLRSLRQPAIDYRHQRSLGAPDVWRLRMASLSEGSSKTLEPSHKYLLIKMRMQPSWTSPRKLAW